MENIYNVAIPEPKTEGKVLAVKDGQWQLGDSIPASSSTDSGKVLTVGSDGKPGWANASGGAEVFTVNVTWDDSSAVMDKHASDILAAAMDGKIINIIAQWVDGIGFYTITDIANDAVTVLSGIEVIRFSESDGGYPTYEPE